MHCLSRTFATPRRLPTVLALMLLVACGESPTEPFATSVEIVPRNVLLQGLGETTTLVAEVRDQFGQLMTGAAVSWSSSDATIVTVDAQGQVAAAGYGEAVIYADYDAARGASAATVLRPIASVLVSPADDTVSLGDTVRFTAQALYDNGDSVPSAEFFWKTSDAVVAGIEAGTGVVTGQGQGRATLTATIADKAGSASVMVVSPDRAALVALHQATDGDNWVNNSLWATESPLEQWHGVYVDENARVSGLYLHRNNLRGPIPDGFLKLPEVVFLYLGDNRLTGRIPSALGNLRRLFHLDLGSNRLSGPIPMSIGGLFRLQTLDLRANLFTGRIPGTIGRLQDLARLYLGGNQLTGPLPLEILGLPKLTWLWLSGNDLSGPIPPEIGNLRKLYELGLSGNDFTGPIPPELGNLTNLWTLALDRNNLSGPIPPELARLNPASLRLCCNNLTGPIPDGLGGMSNLWRVDLGGNDLIGPIPPELGKLPRLWDLTLSGNRLTGPIPPELGDLLLLDNLSLGDNNLHGPVPGELGNLDSLTTLVLSSNPELAGTLPLSLTSLVHLTTFGVGGTGLCAPPDSAFTAWLDGITRTSGVNECTAPGPARRWQTEGSR